MHRGQVSGIDQDSRIVGFHEYRCVSKVGDPHGLHASGAARRFLEGSASSGWMARRADEGGIAGFYLDRWRSPRGAAGSGQAPRNFRAVPPNDP